MGMAIACGAVFVLFVLMLLVGLGDLFAWLLGSEKKPTEMGDKKPRESEYKMTDREIRELVERTKTKAKPEGKSESTPWGCTLLIWLFVACILFAWVEGWTIPEGCVYEYDPYESPAPPTYTPMGH